MTKLQRVLRPRQAFPVALVAFFVFQFYFFTNWSWFPISGNSSRSRVFINSGKDAYIAGPYKRLIQGLGEETLLNEYSYHNRCQSYFEFLYQQDAHWRGSDFHELPYERAIFENKDSFIQNRINEFKQSLDKPGHVRMKEEDKDKMVDEQNLRTLYEVEYNNAIKQTQTTEAALVDAATNLRVYGACYLDQFGKYNMLPVGSPNSNTNHIQSQCSDIEMRMFQWYTKQMPKYTRWDGQVFSTMPVMSNFIKQDDLPPHVPPKISSCYMRTMRDSLNGKGIAISAADKHFEQLVSLIGLLRGLGNKLPIQIVHSGDLTKQVQEALITIARTVEHLNLKNVDNLQVILKKKNITNVGFEDDELTTDSYEKLYPPQELWFVDVSKTITASYKSKFSGYGNKLLAYFFNSFRYQLLIDTDTVPMSDMESTILNSSFFKEHGAYFFKDRELFYQNKNSDSKFFKKLMPSKIDTALFNIPASTEKTLENRFIGQRFAHYMESGVVAMDKYRHFTGVLATIQLIAWAPAASRVWGDKELFWLGMSMSGDEDYYMNNWAAGSAGQVTPRERRLRGDKDDKRRNALIGNELCSTHPAHVSSEDNSTLLWFNAGFTYCKAHEEYKHDFSRELFSGLFDKPTDLLKYYTDYHHIEAVVVPKHAEFWADNDKGENKRGWDQRAECNHFVFCAYDKVGGRDDPVSNGLLIQFDEKTREYYDFLGSSHQYSAEIFKFVDDLKEALNSP